MKLIIIIIFSLQFPLFSFAAEKQKFILKSEILKDKSKRLEIDLNHDGKVDLIETYTNDILTSVERDSKFRGYFDELITFAPYISPTLPIKTTKIMTTNNGKIDRIEYVYRDPQHNLLITTTEVDSKSNGQFDKKWTTSTKLFEKKDLPNCERELKLDDFKILHLQTDVKLVNLVLDKGFIMTEWGYKIHQSCLDQWGAESFPKLLISSMKRGFQCLARLAKDNTKNNSKLPNGAENNLRGIEYILQNSGVTISCNEKKYNWTGTAAHASTSPDETIPELELKHPFISINPNDPKNPLKPTAKENNYLMMTLFHEQFHNLGILHNKSIEFPYACETCCIENTQGQAKRDACKICAGAYTGPADKNYLLDLIVWGKSTYNSTRSAKAIISFQKEFPADRFGLFAYSDAASGIFYPVGLELGKILKQKFSPLSAQEKIFLKNSQHYSDQVSLKAAAPYARLVAESHLALYFEQDTKKVLDLLENNKDKIKELIAKETTATDDNKYIYGDVKTKLNDLLFDIWLAGYPNADKPENKRALEILKATGLLE